MKYQKSLFIFDRAVRLNDNLGLIQCLQESHKVYPVVIFDDSLYQETSYKTKHNRSIRFRYNSYMDLNKQLYKYNSRLFLFIGSIETIIKNIMIKHPDINAVYMNYDYDYRIKNRIDAVNKIIRYYPIKFHVVDHDCCVFNILQIESSPKYSYKDFINVIKQIEPYAKTPLINNYINYIDQNTKLDNEVLLSDVYNVSYMDNLIINKYIHDQITKYQMNDLYVIDSNMISRDHGMNILHNLGTEFKDTKYYLYPYIEFGLISPREVYEVVYKNKWYDISLSKDVMNYLYLKDYIFYISSSLSPTMNVHISNTNVLDSNNILVTRVISGTTGVPIIDAGMRQMEIEGMIDPIVKNILCWFLTNCLKIDKHTCHIILSSKLYDYDGLLNDYILININPNLQIDICNYTKIHNLYNYIIHYVPELDNIPSGDVIDWLTKYEKYDPKNIDYFRPIIIS